MDKKVVAAIGRLRDAWTSLAMIQEAVLQARNKGGIENELGNKAMGLAFAYVAALSAVVFPERRKQPRRRAKNPIRLPAPDLIANLEPQALQALLEQTSGDLENRELMRSAAQTLLERFGKEAITVASRYHDRLRLEQFEQKVIWLLVIAHIRDLLGQDPSENSSQT